MRRRGSAILQLTVAGELCLVKADPEPDESWFRSLGGALKFGVIEARLPQEDSEAMLREAVVVTEGSKDVGISVLNAELLSLEFARELKRTSSTIRRYVLPTDGSLLSAAQSIALKRQGGTELLLFREGAELCIARMTAAQGIDDFTHRDRDVPIADPLRGMLPTKLARMLVNIGIGLSSASQPILLDPFVGTGRVLMEGMLLGAQVYGADVDRQAVEATRVNLEWTRREYKLSTFYDGEQILVSPIEKLASVLSPASIDVIVTEPFLGPPQRTRPTDAESDHLVKELAPLYESLLRAGSSVLKSSGILVAAFPVISSRPLGAEFVDRWARFGYHVLDSVRVSRPDQFIGREIYILQKIG